MSRSILEEKYKNDPKGNSFNLKQQLILKKVSALFIQVCDN
jgi:hypothetical protein